MNIAETVDRIFVDLNTGAVAFAPSNLEDPVLAAISDQKWDCPVQLRERIISELDKQ